MLLVSLGRGGSREAYKGVIREGLGSEGSEGMKESREGSSRRGLREDKTKKGLEEEGRDGSGGV